MTTTLGLDCIRRDGGTRLRVEHKSDIVTEYAEAMRGGAAFPPVVVFSDGSAHWLADGFYRMEAHEAIGATEIAADVREGSQRDAILYAAAANDNHGARRSAADRRRAVQALLADPEWSRWSDQQIARQCGVHPATVGRLRPPASIAMQEIPEVSDSTPKQVTPTPSAERERASGDVIELRREGNRGDHVGAEPAVRKAVRGGTVYEVDVAKIGKRKPALCRMSRTAAKILEDAPVKIDQQQRDALRRMAPMMQQWVARRIRDGESATVAEAKQAILHGAPTGPWERAQKALMDLQPADRLHLCRQVMTVVLGDVDGEREITEHVYTLVNRLSPSEQQRLVERLRRTVEARRSLHVVQVS